MHADQADSRGLNDGVDQSEIPAQKLFKNKVVGEHKDICICACVPSTMFVRRVFCDVVGRVPARLANRIPPRGIFLVAEHDNVLRDDAAAAAAAQPLACFFLDFSDAALVGGDRGEAVLLGPTVAVPDEITGPVVDGNILLSQVGQ
jgi:hypothetical protein